MAALVLGQTVVALGCRPGDAPRVRCSRRRVCRSCTEPPTSHTSRRLTLDELVHLVESLPAAAGWCDRPVTATLLERLADRPYPRIMDTLNPQLLEEAG